MPNKNLQALYEQLQQVQAQLAGLPADAAPEERLELGILMDQVERAMGGAVADALQGEDQVPTVDLSEFPALFEQLKQSIEREQRLNNILGKILGVAKKVAGAAGVPLF